MRRRAARLAALLALAGCALPGRQAPAPGDAGLPPAPTEPGRPALVVLVSVSAMTPDRYRGADPAMPSVARLAAAGVAAAEVEPVAPAARAPAHATLVTGRRPASHRVASERLLGERGVRGEGYTHASQLRGASLWSAAAEARRPVAALGWPTSVGAAIPLLLPDVEIARRGTSWLAELADKTTPWLHELAGRLGGGDPASAAPGPARDATLVAVACEVLAAPQPPALLLLHLGQTRPALAAFGPAAPETARAFAGADGEIARLLACLARAGRLADAALLVAGDHGALDVHSALAPNALLEEAGLLSRDDGGAGLRGWRALARSNGGSAFVYARGEGDALRARHALAARAETSGAFRVVSAEELLALGADPEAWFGLEARPGYVFSDGVGGPAEGPSALRGAGGYLPGRADMAPGFVAWGRGLRRGVRVPWMRQIDVAPTAARLLGLTLDAAEGRPLAGVLDLPPDAAPAAQP